MSSIAVQWTKNPDFPDAIMSAHDTELEAIVQRIVDYLGITGRVTSATLNLSVCVFRWTDNESLMKCHIHGDVNGAAVDRTLSNAMVAAETPPTYWMNPKRLVIAAAITAVTTKPSKADLRAEWRSGMLDRIEIAARQLIDETLGVCGSDTKRKLTRLTWIAGIVGIADAAFITFLAWSAGLSERIVDRIMGTLMFGAIGAILTGGAAYMLGCITVRSKDMADDPTGRRIMSAIGVKTPEGLRRATIIIGLLFVVIAAVENIFVSHMVKTTKL